MRPALDPANALGLIALLSVDVTRSIVLDTDGNVLAGDEGLRAAVAPETPDGWSDRVFVARSERFTLAAETTPRALRGLVASDVQFTLAAMA